MQNEPQVQQLLSPDLIRTIKRAYLYEIFPKPERQTGNSTQDTKTIFLPLNPSTHLCSKTWNF